MSEGDSEESKSQTKCASVTIFVECGLKVVDAEVWRTSAECEDVDALDLVQEMPVEGGGVVFTEENWRDRWLQAGRMGPAWWKEVLLPSVVMTIHNNFLISKHERL